MNDKKQLLGIFDSGVGGFSVLKQIRERSDADVLYFGDCARAPYGMRSQEEITGFIKEILLYLRLRGVTHFVSACNSMSVHTTGKVLEEAGIAKENYMDMVSAVDRFPFRENVRMLIVGTQATIASGIYQSMMKGKNIFFDTFVPMTLAGEIEEDAVAPVRASVISAIEEAISCRSEYMVYACTHYPLVDEIFKEEAAKRDWNGTFIDPAVQVAEEVEKWKLRGSGETLFATSKETPVFKRYSSNMW